MSSIKERIFGGIAEILAGMKSGDEERSKRGQAMVNQAFDNLPPTIRDAYNHINLAAAEIEVGTRLGDHDRVGWGWAAIDDAMLALDALRAKDHDLLYQLDQARQDMWEAAARYLPLEARHKVAAAMTAHQNVLAKLAGGEKL